MLPIEDMPLGLILTMSAACGRPSNRPAGRCCGPPETNTRGNRQSAQTVVTLRCLLMSNLERPLVAAKRPSGNDRLCMRTGGAPPPPLSTKDGLWALSRNPRNRLTPGATGDPVNDRTQKTGPMCISCRLLGPSAHGAGLIVAAFSARASCDASSSPAMWSRCRGGFGLRKTARLLLHLLGLLGDFFGRLGCLLCFLRFLCHVFLWGWLA